MTLRTESRWVIQSFGKTEQQPLVRHRVGAYAWWCTISKEVSKFCSPEVEYLMISCRPHYLPREFSSVFFVALYIPPQSKVGTKTTLN